MPGPPVPFDAWGYESVLSFAFEKGAILQNRRGTQRRIAVGLDRPGDLEQMGLFPLVASCVVTWSTQLPGY